MQGIAEFHKVSFKQFKKDSIKYGFADEDTPDDILKISWYRIKLPKRATGGSSGYDFYLPYPFCLRTGGTVTVPTGIRAEMQPGWCLILMPRSSLGFKYGLKLVNTLGNVDSDYYFAENEGHILAKLTTEINISLKEDDRFIQGVFFPHGLIRNDSTDETRIGGIGSTGV